MAAANGLWDGKAVRGVQFALAAVIIFLIAAAGYITFLVMERQSVLAVTSRYNLAFSAGQGVNEYMRLRQALSALALHPDSERDEQIVQLRYDILLNRLNLYQAGEFQLFIEAAEHRQKAIERIVSAVARLEPVINGEGTIDAEAALRMTDHIEEDFITLASDTNSYGAAAVANDQKQLFKLHWTFTIVVLLLSVSGIALYAVTRQQQGMLNEARKRIAAANEELAGQNLLFEAALDNMSHGLCMFDNAGRIIVSNERMLKIFGLKHIAPGMTLCSLTSEMVSAGALGEREAEDLRQKQDHLRLGGLRGNLIQHMRDGRVVLVSHEPMAGGGWTATYEDITERHKAEAKVAHMARHDALTGLPNRVLLRERLMQTLKEDRNARRQTAVLFLDLDNFKNINDTHGHPFGDKLLKEVGDRIRSIFRSTDTISRVGGDEFVVVHGGIKDKAHLEGMARRLIEALSQPIKIDGRQVITGASVGIAVSEKKKQGADELLKNADLALYQAKAAGRATFAFYKEDMSLQIQRRSRIESELISEGFDEKLFLVYQPITDLKTGQVTSVEALLRWKGPKEDPVSPAEVVSIAEESGIIVELGAWILKTACAAAVKMPSHVSVAVNLSSLQFTRGDIVETVQKALVETGLPPSRLDLEITETLLLDDSKQVIDELTQLKELGIQISLDDFGTGYSSLSYLQKFPVDKIKIDRMFVKEISENGSHKAIVQTIIDMAKALGMRTVAEGVETETQQQVLRNIGCAEVQGYFYSRPLEMDDLQTYLAKKPALVA